MAQATHIQSVHVGDGNAHCGNITGSFNKTVYTSDGDVQIMRWLSPLEPNNRHQGVRNERFDGVGDWLLETSEFRGWKDSESEADGAVLFCSGNPGVGKTYLSSLVIDNLCDQAGEGIVVAGLYCDFLAQQEQTSLNVMGAILKQLVGRGDIPDYVQEAFQKAKKEFGGRGLRLPDLMGLLGIAIASLPKVFICIDALDECLPKHLPKLLESLRGIVRESPRTRIFLTGRPHVREDIQKYFGNLVVIPTSPNKDDIKSYVEMRLDEDADPEAMNDDLRADIIRVILEKISDIFLLVSLNMDAILGEVTIRQRRKKLQEMTKGNGLSDAYTATLTRLKAQKGNKSILGMKTLMWVLYSERPLLAQELCHALGVEVGSPDLDFENVPALRTLLASCLGLVTLEASSSTVRLVHNTLKEYLSSDLTLFHTPHSTIAEVCLTYLNFKCVRDLWPTLYPVPATTPLLEYASYYWGEHTRRGMTENVEALALKLLDRFDDHISAQLILLRYRRDEGEDSCPNFCGPIGFTGLHGAAFLGIVRIVAAILNVKEWDINVTDFSGCAALTWAAVRGHGEVVKMLLDREDVNPNQADDWYGRTALSWAAGNGHEGVVKMLLQRDVNPDQEDTEFTRTPLLWAARNGHEGVVKMLLEHGDVNPNRVDTQYGRTPLLWATWNGYEKVVKVLLERGDVNSDQADTRRGRTPLSWATWSGNEGIVKLLLARGDVNPNQADTKYNRTPLSLAAEKGYEGVVKMLLERGDVNPNHGDTWTPLSWAAVSGHMGVVRMLLQRGDVSPDKPDTEYGTSPLLLAAGAGHEGVVKMLLERGDVNPNQTDTEYCRTPLSWAAWGGHEGVVKVLLERRDVDPGQTDPKHGRTPLSWASENGHEGVVVMLLERGDVNPNQADTGGCGTPLSLAAESGHTGVVKLLLELGGVNPDQTDNEYGATPLLLAARAGHEGVVEVFLERGGVNPDQADTEYDRTPLSWASGNGDERVVKMLLEQGDVSPNQADIFYDRTPLSWAAGNGHEGVVKMLLERGDVNPDQADSRYCRTPLSWAADQGHEGVVKMLLGRKDVSTTTPDNANQTPLSRALSKGHDQIVKTLLERDSVNSDREDRVI